MIQRFFPRNPRMRGKSHRLHTYGEAFSATCHLGPGRSCMEWPVKSPDTAVIANVVCTCLQSVHFLNTGLLSITIVFEFHELYS